MATAKVRVATVWLDGCSGCHMSFLDIDHRLLDIADRIELVYSPLVDLKTFPPDVDVTLVEGAISSDDDLEKIKHVRARTKILVALGDCSVTGNVPSMRNPIKVQDVLTRAYLDPDLTNPGVPTQVVPHLLPYVRPIHTAVKVDIFIPGCPPHADTIFYVVAELLEGRLPDLSAKTRFGA
ncbi:MAG: NADP oxidoreductase [Chloroflexi bacterium]|uniref:NADH-quinone oxidoreductase subunit B family protein n=1 Tax=Candidatus Flexifilum breve TaxID=3140694 RepID=UPI00313678EC|nr:NADP oxidoreductase [Chloroflexota bacterium]